MENKMKTLVCICLVVTLFVVASSATDCFVSDCTHRSRASFFSIAGALKLGACGYGALAPGLNDGRIAAVAPSIYRGGLGCGGCFKIRCTDQRVCSKAGTMVIATDQNTNTGTDFVLSSRAFKAMANKGMASNVSRLGTVGIEYRRVPCSYKSNVMIRVHESSRKPNYLAIQILNKGGQTDILVVEVAGQKSNWTSMTKPRYGAVWETYTVPSGPLRFRFVVIGGYDAVWYNTQFVVPGKWSLGAVYDTGVKFTAAAQDGCSPCNG